MEPNLPPLPSGFVYVLVTEVASGMAAAYPLPIDVAVDFALAAIAGAVSMGFPAIQVGFRGVEQHVRARLNKEVMAFLMAPKEEIPALTSPAVAGMQ